MLLFRADPDLLFPALMTLTLWCTSSGVQLQRRVNTLNDQDWEDLTVARRMMDTLSTVRVLQGEGAALVHEAAAVQRIFPHALLRVVNEELVVMGVVTEVD